MARITIETHKRNYINALKQGNQEAADQVIFSCLVEKFDLPTLYLKILTPAQQEIGKLWSRGKINIAEEHLATQLTLRQMDRIRTTIQPAAKKGFKVMVTSVEGDQHFLGARMLADFFLAEGWEVDYLGSNTPIQDLVEFIRRRRPEVIALSSSVKESLSNLEKSVEAIRKLPVQPGILIGGAAVNGQASEKLKAEADIILSDPAEAVRKAKELVERKRGRLELEDFLIGIGQKIQRKRQEFGWSQQQLANAAGLDRTYISLVEHGKQNLSLSALLRLAQALDILPEELVSMKNQ
jgi:methanogenic corrinoid protein MtbC1/DNA-binding XRE family transcriptional regulator